jgi:hypothetical protein
MPIGIISKAPHFKQPSNEFRTWTGAKPSPLPRYFIQVCFVGSLIGVTGLIENQCFTISTLTLTLRDEIAFKDYIGIKVNKVIYVFYLSLHKSF